MSGSMSRGWVVGLPPEEDDAPEPARCDACGVSEVDDDTVHLVRGEPLCETCHFNARCDARGIEVVFP